MSKDAAPVEEAEGPRCFHCGDRATGGCAPCGKYFDERCRSFHDTHMAESSHA